MSPHHPHNVFPVPGGLYGWRLGGQEKVGYKTWSDAAMDYLTALFDAEPEVARACSGKTWREMFEATGLLVARPPGWEEVA